MPIISILLTDKVIGLLKQFYLMTVQSKKLIFNYQAMCDYFLMNKPDILVVLDGDKGSLPANAAAIHAQDFLDDKPESLKPFQAIVIAGEVQEGMLRRLEKFVAGGGRVVFALPSKSGDMPSNPKLPP